MRDALDHDVTNYSSQVGCGMKPDRLVRFINDEFGTEKAFAFIPKYVLTQLFTKFSDFIPNWHSYPATPSSDLTLQVSAIFGDV